MINVRMMVIIVVTILVIPSSSAAENDKEYFTGMDLIEGDFFDYNLDMSGVLNSYLEEPNLDVNEVINNEPDNLMTFTSYGNSCINIENNCLRMIRSYEVNITLIHDDDSQTFTDDTTLMMSFREVSEEGENIYWSELTENQEIWMQVDGEDFHQESIVTTITDSTRSQMSPNKISVGDSWSFNIESDIVTIIRERIDGGDWDTETTEESWSNTTNFFAESSGAVFIDGESHDTVKVSKQDLGENEVEFVYYNVNGIPIKSEFFDESGVLLMLLTLNEYDYSNEPTDQSSLTLPGFGFIAATSMIMVATLIPKKRD
jgi:hypothetical protein